MFQLASQLRRLVAMRTAWCVLIGISAAACTTGEDNVTPPDPNGKQCTAIYTVTGTFAQSTARPLGGTGMPITGCWPIGMWTFNVALVSGMNTCTPTPTPLSQYQFMGTTTTDPVTGDYLEQFSYVPQASDPTAHSIAKANTGGTGSCAGELSLFSADGTQVWLLKPETVDETATSAINGIAEFNVYNGDQYQPPG